MKTETKKTAVKKTATHKPVTTTINWDEICVIGLHPAEVESKVRQILASR